MGAGGPERRLGHDMGEAHEHMSIEQDGFDAVAMESESTLNFLGAPAAETKEFMDIIESYRTDVVA